jgi:putative hydrolase of the HAD superfamily
MVTPVKNIIFDLGGVLLNLNYQLTRIAFENIGVQDFDAFYTQHKANPLFENLEVGAIEPEVFYESLRKATGLTLSNAQLETAWNAMLLDFPTDRLQWLDQIKNKYNIYLFSNTNAIHYKAFTSIYAQTAPLIGLNPNFNHFFKEAHYSHTLGQRKPDVAAFDTVLSKSGLDPSQTLFIDDTISNIEGAQKAGLQTIFLSGGLTVQDLGL